MPRYYYECKSCQNISLYVHSIADEPKECIICAATGSLFRDYSNNAFIVPEKNLNETKQKAGTLTKEYIEKNRQILNKQKQELKNKEYEQT